MNTALLASNHDAGLPAAQLPSTDAEIVEVWLGRFDNVNTLRLYKRSMELLLEFLLVEGTALRFMTPAQAQRFAKWLQDDLKGTPATIKQRLGVVAGFFTWLADVGWRTGNPIKAGVRVAAVAKRKHRVERFLSPEQISAVLDAVKGPPPPDWRPLRWGACRWITQFLLYTGLRRHEAANVRLGDIYRHDGQLILRVTGKGEKAREVPLHPDLVREWLPYQESRHARPLPLETVARTTPDLPFLAQLHTSDGMSPESIYQHLRAFFRALAGRDISPHWLRHTFVTMLMDKDADPMVVKDLVGHASLQTLSIYRGVSDAARIRTVGLLRAH